MKIQHKMDELKYWRQDKLIKEAIRLDNIVNTKADVEKTENTNKTKSKFVKNPTVIKKTIINNKSTTLQPTFDSVDDLKKELIKTIKSEFKKLNNTANIKNNNTVSDNNTTVYIPPDDTSDTNETVINIKSTDICTEDSTMMSSVSKLKKLKTNNSKKKE